MKTNRIAIKVKIIAGVGVMAGVIAIGVFFSRSQITAPSQQNHNNSPTLTENKNIFADSERECAQPTDSVVRDYCYSEMAKKSQNIDICDRATKSGKNLCYSKVAAEKKDYGLCDQIKDESGRQVCYEMVAVSLQIPAECEKIPTPYTQDNKNIKSLCYSEIGKANDDPETCARVEFDSYRAGCYAQIATNRKNLSLCDMIDLQGDKYYCYGDVAAAKKDVSICDTITNSAKYSCYIKTAESTNDATVCEKIIEPGFFKDECYMIFGIQPGNRDLAAATTSVDTDQSSDDDTEKALQSARNSGAMVIKESEHNYEIIDKPLPKWNFPQKYYGKKVELTVRSAESGGQTYGIVLDTVTGDYQVTANMSNDFYFVDANGIVCYGRPKYKNTYCVREKYTSLALVKYFAGQKEQENRDLSWDESQLQRMMIDYGWLPNNLMAAMMSIAEFSFSQLSQDKLSNGKELIWTSEDGKSRNMIGTVVNFDFNEPRESLRTKGIHLATLLADIYNTKDNPIIWDKANDTFTIPYFNIENSNMDEAIDNFFDLAGIEKQKYNISQ